MKEILVITNSLYPDLNANSNIAYEIAKFLKESYNCDVTVMGYRDNIFNYAGNENAVNIIEVKGISSINSIVKKCKQKGKIKLLLHPMAVLFVILRLLEREGEFKKILYKKEIQKSIGKQNYDCIIAFSEPTYVLEALSEVDCNIPYISYKLDPWSYHYLRNTNKNELKKEMKSDEKASAIVITKAMENWVKTNGKKLNKKTYAFELPCVTEHAIGTKYEAFDDKKINCVFAGGLYKDIRNPRYMIELFKLINSDKIILHIFGNLYHGLTMPENLPQNIIYHGNVDSEKSISIMQSADVLVNLGNTISNQMPSKVLTYISLGKPILNIVKIENCPSIEYLKEYPYAISVFENRRIDQGIISKIEDFCMTMKGKGLPYEYIKEKYKECTLDYVGQELYSIIKKISK